MAEQKLQLPKWFDLHTHFRQGPNVPLYLRDHQAMGCAGALAMPNTQPPVARVFGANDELGWSLESYRQELINAGADSFEKLIVPLYLTGEITPQHLEAGAADGILEAAKYYPPHGTTNSAHGMPIDHWISSDILKSMEDLGLVLCLHGEQHGLEGPDYFDSETTAESIFYKEWMPRLLDQHPNLKIVCEHITTQEAVEFVSSAPSQQVAATITPQHLLFTVGHLIQGLKYHLYCLPVVKFRQDRQALRDAISQPQQSQFFAGTDSAPHTTKATDCGCAAGCYTGGCAPQLYAMAFEEAGVDLFTPQGQACFENFLCTNGPAHYGFEPSKQQFSLSKSIPSEPTSTSIEGITSLPQGLDIELAWTIT